MARYLRIPCVALLALSAATAATLASAQARDPGWDIGGDLVWQDKKTINFNGGTQVRLDDDWGLSFTFGYRFNSKVELHFALDWSDMDYDATLLTDTTPQGTVEVSGTAEAFTPRVNVHYNFIDGPLTPFVMAGFGYSFIDTNIPEGRPSNVCWWDPWWGYVCGTVQPTKGVDEFSYQFGLGVRWDFSPTVSLRASIEKHYIDLPNTGTPGVGQVKVGVVWRGY